MSKAETRWDWTQSDCSTDHTVIVSTDKGVNVESQTAIESHENEVDEHIGDMKRSLKKEIDISIAFINISRYTHNEGVHILDKCPFHKFREFCIKY